jgi:hypothetical protein
MLKTKNDLPEATRSKAIELARKRNSVAYANSA